MGKSSQDRSAMAKAVGQIEAKVSSITGHQRTLGDQVNGLIGQGWQGQAAQKFLQGFQQFDGEMSKTLNALTELKEKVQTALGHYSSTEEDAAGSTSAISAGLG
jgi:WXG100 family type VII secretion target